MVAANNLNDDHKAGAGTAERPNRQPLGQEAPRTGNVQISRSGGAFRLTTALWLPHPIEQVFGFFADPRNLDSITPGWLRFRMVTPWPVLMRRGLLLDYELRWRGVPISWQSEIAVWESTRRFVDVQRKGPYRSWSHEHTFVQKDGGTNVEDCVDYSVPGGWITNQLVVGRDLLCIFEYRRNRLKEIFGASPAVLGSDAASEKMLGPP